VSCILLVMLIAQIYDPPIRQGLSAEESIMANDLRDLYDEIRLVIQDTKVIISKRRTIRGKGRDTTGAPGLASSLNKAFKKSLESLGWCPLVAPGATKFQSTVDWYKGRRSPVKYERRLLGIGLEIQMGNNYQFNEDIRRLSEAFLGGYTVAGISIVASDVLAKHKADRGAYFSDAKGKLNRNLALLYAAQARRIPPILILAVQHDGYNDDPDGYFEIQPVIYSREERVLKATISPAKISNRKHPVIVKRMKTRMGLHGV